MRTLSCLVVLVLAGCGMSDGEVTAADDLETSTSALTFPAHEIAPLLALVNDPVTDFYLLNDLIALDSRAAKNILDRRMGPDLRYLSADDNRYDSLAELDAVAYVGDTTLLKLRAWALTHPQALPELVEGVDFTAAQVSDILWGINQASLVELDVDAGLDGRAATALITGRPYPTMSKLGTAAYVGSTALLALRSYSAVWTAKRWGTTPALPLAGTFDGVFFDEASAKAALTLTNTATREKLVAIGVPATGAAPIVGNRPYTSLTQLSAVSGVGPSSMKALLAYVSVGTVALDGVCSPANRCGTGLVCAGLTVNPQGICRSAWMAGTFTSTTVTAIPDANTAGITSTILVSGLATVPEDIVVHLDIDHPRPADLRVVLVQPSSAESIVWAFGSTGPARVIPTGGVEYDSSVNGAWTIQIVDIHGGSAGTLLGWSLELTSRMD